MVELRHDSTYIENNGFAFRQLIRSIKLVIEVFRDDSRCINLLMELYLIFLIINANDFVSYMCYLFQIFGYGFL